MRTKDTNDIEVIQAATWHLIRKQTINTPRVKPLSFGGDRQKKDVLHGNTRRIATPKVDNSLYVHNSPSSDIFTILKIDRSI